MHHDAPCQRVMQGKKTRGNFRRIKKQSTNLFSLSGDKYYYLSKERVHYDQSGRIMAPKNAKIGI
jgi:hypothetical protein